MSLHDTRVDIALALRTVEGVTGYQYRPAIPKPGDAWPLLGGLERADGMAFYVTWRVIVYLPQKERAASDFIDEKYEAIVDALAPYAFVDRIDAVDLGVAPNSIYGLEITMRGE